MAPERISARDTSFMVGGFSKESDVYSLAMTSFSVRPSFRNHPTTKQSSRYDQILTGVSPYHGSNVEDMITDIRSGKRPSRPIDLSQSRFLQDPIWDTITTGWHDQPKRRCKLSAMHHTFSPPNQRQQHAKILLRITSFFQFVRNSESENQRLVNEMNQVTSSTSPLLKADMASSVSRMTSCRIGSD